MPRRKKAVEPMLDDTEDRPRRTTATTVIRAEESPNRVVLPRKINRPRPGDKVGFRPIVF